MRLYIKTITGETHFYEVNPSDTILSVKEKIKNRIALEIKHQKLNLNMVELKDEQTLEECDIKSDDQLYLIVKMQDEPDNDGMLSVIIKTGDGNNMTLSLKPGSSIDDLKTAIESNQQSKSSCYLIYDGKTLSPGKKLEDYNITNNSIIHMTYVLPGGL